MHNCFINICVPLLSTRRHLVSILIVLGLITFPFCNTQAQPCTSYLSGSYTVGLGGDFPTLTAAANAYNTSCITANVTFVLTNSTYAAPAETFPIIFSRNTTAGPSTRLSIMPQSGLTVYITGSVNYGALIKINGSFIDFNGRGIADTSRQLYLTNNSVTEPRVIQFASNGSPNAVTNCSVNNCVLTNGTNDKSVLFFSDANSFTAPGFFSNISIQRNVFRKSLYGIYFLGATSISNGNGLLINSNELNATGINAISYCAIYLKGADGATITNNQIGNFIGTDTASDRGIFIADTVRNTLIAGNKIFNLNNTAGRGWGAQGIYIGTNLPNANITVMNNMIGNITGDGNDYTNATYTLENPTGILLSCSGTQGGIRIYNNTIALGTVPGFTNTLNRSGAISSCIRLRTGSSAEIRNNILYNSLGLAGSSGFGATCILLSQSANQLPVLDYNNYHVAPIGNGAKLLGHIFSGNVQSASLAAWRTATSKDVNSTNLLPIFTSSIDLHLATIGNSALNNTGSYIAGYSFDIDSCSRGLVKVDVGCDEFVPANTVNWIGKYSADWFNPLNWEANVLPDSTKDLTMVSGSPFLPVLSNSTAVRNINLASLGFNTMLAINNNVTFQVFGTMTRSGGMIDALEGIIELAGNTPQRIPPAFFKSNGIKDLLISNSAANGVTLDGPLDIYRSLKFLSTGIALNTNDFLTLKSNATQTAWVGDLTGKSINGKVTVERFIPTGINHGKSWQFLSAPVNGSQTIQQAWQDSATAPNQNRYPGFGTQITGNYGGNSTTAINAGFDVYTAAGSTMKVYDAVNASWQFISNTNATPISNTKGYFVFVRGDRSVTTYNAPAVPTVLRSKGNLYSAQPGTAPASVTVLPNAFESVGNPYASTIDFSQLIRSGEVDPVFYVWDPLLNGVNGLGGFQFISAANGYRPLPGGTANYNSAVAYPFIQSGQAFLVHSNNLGGSISFSESAKTEGSATTFRELDEQEYLQISLSALSNNQPHVLDAAVVSVSSSFTNDIDSYDVSKLNNPGENLYIQTSGKSLSLSTNQSWDAIDTIYLMLTNSRIASYRFLIQTANLSDEGYGLFLYDKYLHQESVINEGDTSLVEFGITADSLSKAVNRFMIIRKPISLLPLGFDMAAVFKKGNNLNQINWKFSELSRVFNFDIEKSIDGSSFHTIGSKVVHQTSEQFFEEYSSETNNIFYRIKANLHDNRLVYSPVLTAKNTSVGSTSLSIIDYGNQQIRVFNNNIPNGNYLIQIYTSDGALLKIQDIQVSDNQLDRLISLPSTISRKAMIVKLINTIHSQPVLSQTVFVQ